VLALAAACALFSLGAALAAALTRMPRRWLWALAALVGVTKLTVDWSTGTWQWAPLQFVLFSAGVIRPGPLANWLVTVAFPLGPLLAMQRVRRARRSVAPAVDGSLPAAAAPDVEPAASDASSAGA
jgi:hypothetical protein